MKLTFFNRHSQVLPVNNNETLSRSPRHGVNESIQEQFETRGGTNPSFPVRIRRRVSSHFQQSKQREPSSPTSSAVNFEESLATNPKHASMLSWRFLMGPHHFDSPLHLDDVMEAPQEVLVYDFKIGRLRSRTQLIVHFLMELHMLRRDIGIIAFGIVWQWVHSVFTNLAYYYHAQLTAAQRVPLQDIAFGFLPKLQGGMWMASEYLVYSMVAIIVLAILSILFISYSAPHGRPLYCIPILRRMLLTLVFCQTLRIISFMCTTLPGASRQCLYDIQPNTTLTELISGPAPLNGNPERWEPPETISDIFWRVDPTNGCGDLMFSSHTIFTMLFVCVVWKYFNWKPLKVVMALCQVSTTQLLNVLFVNFHALLS